MVPGSPAAHRDSVEMGDGDGSGSDFNYSPENQSEKQKPAQGLVTVGVRITGRLRTPMLPTMFGVRFLESYLPDHLIGTLGSAGIYGGMRAYIGIADASIQRV